MNDTTTEPGGLTPDREQQIREEAEPYRDDVRDVLTAQGWAEDAEGFLRKDGALWTETNDSLDSGLDGPGKGYAVEFTRDVPAPVVVAACLAAVGVDVAALLAALDRARAERDDAVQAREATYERMCQTIERGSALLRESQEIRAERDRYEAEAHQYRTALQGAAREAEADRAELDGARDGLRFLHENTLPELRRTAEHHEAGKKRWRDRAEKAEGKLHALAQVRVWRNEDRKGFLFADDVAAALGIKEQPATSEAEHRAAVVAERDAEIIAWLLKKAREYASAPARQESVPDAIARLADKISRGAVRGPGGTLAERDAKVRRAGLREAADAVFALAYNDQVEDDEAIDSIREAWDLGTIHAADLLRRMADEAGQGGERS